MTSRQREQYRTSEFAIFRLPQVVQSPCFISRIRRRSRMAPCFFEQAKHLDCRLPLARGFPHTRQRPAAVVFLCQRSWRLCAVICSPAP